MYGHSNPTIRTTKDGEQVGPRMHKALKILQARGVQPSMNQLAKACGPNDSQDYGYRVVHRCRKKNLLEIDPDHESATPNGRGAVKLTQKGVEYLENQE